MALNIVAARWHPISYLGKKKGVFKADEMVDIILNRKHSHLMTRKFCNGLFINQTKHLFVIMGIISGLWILNSNPLLTKIFTEVIDKKSAGSKLPKPARI
jgi:hypothetical protein